MNIIRCALLLIATAALAGCATTVPEFDIPRNKKGAPTVATIRAKIVCELEEIATGTDLERYTSDVNDVNVAIQLTLDVTEDGALAPTFTYMNGVFSFGTGFTLEQSREQNFTEQLFYSMREVKLRSENSNWRSNCKAPPDTNLSGRIGLREAFDLAMTANPDLNWDAAGADGVFGGTVTFVVKKDLTATGPTWTLTHFKGPGQFATLSSDNNDKLFFAFTKGKKADKNAAALAKAKGLSFISSLIQTQQAVSLNAISRSVR